MTLLTLGLNRHENRLARFLRMQSAQPHVKLISKQIAMCWQKRWNVASTGRATYDLCPAVGQKPFLPLDRYTAVSYVRLLLHDISLDPHHRAVSASRICRCGTGTDDMHHFFFECRMYEKSCQEVTATVRNIWEECEQSSSSKLTLPLLLAPATISFLNSIQRRTILLSTFQFIKRSASIL